MHVFALLLVLVGSTYALTKHIMNITAVVKLTKLLRLLLGLIALCENVVDILVEAEIDLRPLDIKIKSLIFRHIV